jgi:hypothetical protein
MLVSEHFGFRKGMSIQNVAFKLIDSVLEDINKNNAYWWNIF